MLPDRARRFLDLARQLMNGSVAANDVQESSGKLRNAGPQLVRDVPVFALHIVPGTLYTSDGPRSEPNKDADRANYLLMCASALRRLIVVAPIRRRFR